MSGKRGQSETIGVLLLTGVVVVTATAVGMFALTNYTDSATDEQPLFTCTIEYDDNAVTVTHAGGQRVDTSTLIVILRNSSGQTRLGFDSGADGRFETGERQRFGAISTATTVLVATNRGIACQNTLEV